MLPAFIHRLRHGRRPFVLFHTYDASLPALAEAVRQRKSMDLDIAVDSQGNPYLGHSAEFYEKSGETQPENMDFWEAVRMLERTPIPLVVDCKGEDAWPISEELVERFGPHRCVVHVYGSELKFDYDCYDHDYPSEWVALAKLRGLKERYPNATTTASAKFLPSSLLIDPTYKPLLHTICELLHEHSVNTVCLNVPDKTASNESIRYFLERDIVPHLNVDRIESSRLSEIYVGETDHMACASEGKELGY